MGRSSWQGEEVLPDGQAQLLSPHPHPEPDRKRKELDIKKGKADTQEEKSESKKDDRKKPRTSPTQQKTVKKKEDSRKEAKKPAEARSSPTQVKTSYLQVPGPEVQRSKLLSPSLGFLAGVEKSSGSCTSSWDPQEFRYLVGKNKGAKGAVTIGNHHYPLHGFSCQAAASRAALSSEVAVPPDLGSKGEGRRQAEPNTGIRQESSTATTADTPRGIPVFSWGNTRCGKLPEGFEKVTDTEGFQL